MSGNNTDSGTHSEEIYKDSASVYGSAELAAIFGKVRVDE